MSCTIRASTRQRLSQLLNRTTKATGKRQAGYLYTFDPVHAAPWGWSPSYTGPCFGRGGGALRVPRRM